MPGATSHRWQAISALKATPTEVAAVAAGPDHIRVFGPRPETEAVARAIHASNPRGRLVWLVCDDLPEAVIWSELFGHTAGAFPGAFRDYRGQIWRADGGTLVIAGAESLSPRLHTMLDGHATTGEVWPIGAVVPSGRVDVRLVALFAEAAGDNPSIGSNRTVG